MRKGTPMKKLDKKWKLLLYGISGMGVNMLNLMMGSYLCSAILVGGFGESAVKYQTFEQKDLVIAAAWAVFVLISKIVDGVIDIPMASLTDNLKTRWGRRRPALIIGLVPMIAAYLLFLVCPDPSGATWLNTIYYGIVLCVFYIFYTLTMVTYYATFTEITANEADRSFLSNVKSVCDIVYFIIGYVVVAGMLKGMNIRLVAVLILPIVATMLIPMFLIREESTLAKDAGRATDVSKPVNLFRSLGYTFKNANFIKWMFVYSVMQFSMQLFLSGINEYFSKTGMSMMIVMMSAFAPVPFTLIIFNKLKQKKGFGFALRYVLIIYSVGMFLMFAAGLIDNSAVKMALSITSGVVASFGIGALFSVAYSIPAQLAAEDEQKTGISHSAMYFAVQGLFAGIATGIGSGAVLTALKGTEEHPTNAMVYMTLISGIGMLVSLVISYMLPKSLQMLGKVQENK